MCDVFYLNADVLNSCIGFACRDAAALPNSDWSDAVYSFSSNLKILDYFSVAWIVTQVQHTVKRITSCFHSNSSG